MAEKIILTLEIEGTQREIKNVKDLKGALKDAQSELLKFEAGSAGFQKAQKNIGDLKGKLNDLGDAARIEGTAAEQLSSRFSLLRESLATGDMDKAKLALGGIGSAMKAIPIIALVEAARLLVENFGEIVKWGKDFFDIATDAERAVKNLNIQLKDQQANNKIIIQSLEDEIGLMKAHGATEEQVIARKKQITALKISEIETQILLNKHKLEEVKNAVTFNDVLGGTIASLLQMYGLQKQANEQAIKVGLERAAREKEVSNQIKADEAAIAHLKASLEIDITNAHKQGAQERKKVRDQELEQRIAEEEYWTQISNEIDASRDAMRAQAEKDKYLAEQERKRLEEEAIIAEIFANGQMEADAYNALRQIELQEEAAHIQRKLAIHAAFEAKKYDLALAGVNATKAISDLLIQGNLNSVKKGSAQELALKKKQFEVNKGIDIARATIDGIKGAQAQLSAGPIVGPILAAAVGVTALANVLKIKNTQFQDSGGPSIDTSVPSVSAPSIPTPQSTPRLPSVDSTRLNEGGVVTAVVVETNMSESQKRVSRLKNQATFG